MNNSSDLLARVLSKDDDIRQIFELCKQNNMLTANYATSQQVWDFQYKENPIEKSWNAVITDENELFGHIGLYPLPIRAFSENLIAGSISNGVLSKSIRNKLLPYKDKKTFAVIPLIESCYSSAFNDDVDLIFVYSSIHPMIWKTLKFSTIDIESKTTYHSGLKKLYLSYCQLINDRKSKKLTGVFGSLYALTLTALSIVPKSIQKALSVFYSIGKENLIINDFEEFDSEFHEFFDVFIKNNSNLITYNRDLDYLNWKFKAGQFRKYKILSDNKLVGYIIFQKTNLENDFKVIDFVLLNQYINKIQNIFNHLTYVNDLSFIFTHFLSCDYSYDIYNECIKQGVAFNLNPLKKYMKGNKPLTLPLYYKLNDSKEFSTRQKKHFEDKSWFISPIFFTPTYFE